MPRKLEKPSLNRTSSKSYLDNDIKDRQKIIRLAESMKMSEEKVQFEPTVRKSSREYYCNAMDDVYDPAAKMLVLTIKWLHGVSSFVQMKSTEQMCLLHSNWKELFILTIAQYSFEFDEGEFSLFLPY